MRGQVEICGCFPTGRHYPGIADRLAKARIAMPVPGLATGFEPDLVWAEASFAVIDFETTGLDPATDRVIEMGIVCFDDGVLSASQNWLIQPTIPVPAEATAVHGITDEMLADQPRFEAIWSEIRTHLEGRLPVAYNAGFDKRFLLAELERMGETTWGDDLPPAMQSEVEWVDPLVWVRELYPEQSAKLGEICKHLEIPLEGAHRASNDAEATGRVLMTMQERMPATYAELIRVQVRYAAQQDVDLAIWRGRRF
ncbi:MAG: 3'-5' exonuclease [Sandaracinaceae bacterium]|nr:3'-5' exonuclease [Sandaracinaceae bacterium]